MSAIHEPLIVQKRWQHEGQLQKHFPLSHPSGLVKVHSVLTSILSYDPKSPNGHCELYILLKIKDTLGYKLSYLYSTSTL